MSGHGVDGVSTVSPAYDGFTEVSWQCPDSPLPSTVALALCIGYRVQFFGF